MHATRTLCHFCYLWFGTLRRRGSTGRSVVTGGVRMRRANMTGTGSDLPGGWRLRAYLVWLVVLFVAAAGAAMVYGGVSAERDAGNSALQDAAFGARLSATEIDADVGSIRQAVAGLAANPEIAQAFATPAGCSLELQLAGGPDAGHLDLIRTDGTVVCSSKPAASGSGGRLGTYAGTPWWPAVAQAAVSKVPVADVRSGQQALVVTVPVPGAGVVAGFLNLAVLGTTLNTLYTGPRHVSFLVTTGDGTTLLTRSGDPARWAGTRLAGTAFGTGTGTGVRRDVTGQQRLYARVEIGRAS